MLRKQQTIILNRLTELQGVRGPPSREWLPRFHVENGVLDRWAFVGLMKGLRSPAFCKAEMLLWAGLCGAGWGEEQTSLNYWEPRWLQIPPFFLPCCKDSAAICFWFLLKMLLPFWAKKNKKKCFDLKSLNKWTKTQFLPKTIVKIKAYFLLNIYAAISRGF